MLDFADLVDLLGIRVEDPIFSSEKGWHPTEGKITITVYRGGKNGPAIFAVPGREVRSPTEEANPVRSASYNDRTASTN